MAEKLTITEALAEIKTISKRIAKKQATVTQYLARPEALKDPLHNDGGSVEFVKRERQAVGDLEDRIVELRRRIAAANAATNLKVGYEVRSIADWLTWRREVAPGYQQFLTGLRRGIEAARKEAQQRGVQVISAAAAVQMGDVKPTDLIVNVSEVELNAEAEQLEEMLGILDGLLSLKNATTQV